MIDAGTNALWDSDYPKNPAAFSEDVVWSILYRALQAGGFSPQRLSEAESDER
jgi:hypothetical protein